MVNRRTTLNISKTVAVLILVQAIILIAPIRAYCLHTNNATAMIVKDDIFIFNNEQMKIIIFHNAESPSDVSVYGHFIDIANKYKGQDVQILSYAVSKYQEDTAKFMTYAPDWDLHYWLSLPEYQKLSKELNVYRMNIGEVKDLPYLAVITPQGNIIGQWKGIENRFLSKICD